MSLLALLMGHGVFITGVEDQSDGSTRVYVGPRYHGIYFDEPAEDVEAARVAWRNAPAHLIADAHELPELKRDAATA